MLSLWAEGSPNPKEELKALEVMPKIRQTSPEGIYQLRDELLLDFIENFARLPLAFLFHVLTSP